jgi:hypothetical protein
MPKFVLQVIAAIALSASLTAQVGPPRTITIRLYNSYEVPRRQLNKARQTADAIFNKAGLAPAWRECRTPQGPSAKSKDMCADVLGRNEVIVRIVASPTMRNDDKLVLGYSHVDAGAGAGTLATVFADTVGTMSGHMRVDTVVLLGRVIAHELGHLLMGSLTHSTDGLMRERWSADVPSRAVTQDWLFSEREIAFLQTGLLARWQGIPIPVINLAERTQRTTP